MDEENDMKGAVIIEDGIIVGVLNGEDATADESGTAMIIDGHHFTHSETPPVLMPSFVDLHAHFRDPGIYGNNSLNSAEAPFPAETVESASLAAAAGGFGTVVCMANTKPPIDAIEQAAALKSRSDALGLVDLYPVLSLTKNMEGKELSEITELPTKAPVSPNVPPAVDGGYIPLMLSEDGKDLADDGLFLKAMTEAKRIGIPVSCHCDFGGDETAAAKKAGLGRSVWSRIEENNAVERAIALGKKALCRIHIAHVSTKEAVDTIRRAKKELQAAGAEGGFTLTCEAMPHNLCLTEEDARKLGEESWGRVNPPLRSEEDRKALTRAVADGTVDAIATDHAPHSGADKEKGAAGFSGFETAFAAAYTELVRGGTISLMRLSSLMSARPARLLGLEKRGRILPGCRADLVIADLEAGWVVDTAAFFTRGKNSPFQGRRLFGKILMTIRGGRVVYGR